MNRPIPVRFDDQLHARVKARAISLGMTASAIVRWSVIRHIDEMERSDKVTLKRAKRRAS